MIHFSQHALVMAGERRIDLGWIRRALTQPQKVETAPDGTVHYLLRVTEREGRWLRVVTVGESEDVLVITAFFDRRIPRARS